MSHILKTLLGNSSKMEELPQELRAILAEMQLERASFEALAARLQNFAEPIAKAEGRVSALAARVESLEQSLSGFGQLATRARELTAQTDELTKSHRRTEARVAHTVEDAERIRLQIEEIAHKADLALCLKDELSTFLEMKDPFERVRVDADNLSGTVRGLFDEVGRIRTQHDKIVRGQEQATSQLGAFEQRRARLDRVLEHGERRVAKLEESLARLSELAASVRDTKQELSTLEALAEYITQKVATLEEQRTVADQAIDRAETLDGLVRRVNAGLRQQQEQAKTMGGLQTRLAEIKRLHTSVVERSEEIAARQREIDERQETTGRALAALREEARRSVDRLESEKQGVDTVSQRMVDLRSGLADFEHRFRALNESSQTLGAVQSQAESLAMQVESLHQDIVGLEDEARKARTVRRELADLDDLVTEARDGVGRIEEVRPALETALRDFESLSRSHALVMDGLEQVRVAQSDIGRMRESQSETQSWLAGVQQSLDGLRGQVAALNKMRPTIDFAQRQVHRINEALSAIDARRGFVKEIHKRLTELTALGGTLDERSQRLLSRMESVEQQFGSLSVQAEEAERLAKTMSGVAASVEEAERGVTEVGEAVAAVEGRCEQVEGLATRMRRLREEVEQRQQALDEGMEDLGRASALRQEAAAAVQDLDERVNRLSGALASADKQAIRMASVSSQLEERASALRFVEKRIENFEERLAKWELAEPGVVHSLDQIARRQATVEAIQAEIDRLSAVAERTASDVRRTTEAQNEVAETRTILDSVLERFHEAEAAADTLDHRKRQMEQAEHRLARAEAVLIDIRSTLETLQGQKVIVDHAVEKAGSLKFLLKQSEALIETLREEREVTGRLRSALAELREEGDVQQQQATIANAS